MTGAREQHADVVILGGGVGGCAAALAATRAGADVVMTEETAWIGGQLTSQAVPPDEHPWIESFGCTASYRAYRNAVRQYYRDHYPLTVAARTNRELNPGSGGVSRLCHEPRVALAVLTQMLAPAVSAGRLTILTEHKPVEAEVEGDNIRSITAKSLRTGGRVVLHGPVFIDATELGDVLPLANVEYVTGFEGIDETGEPHGAPEPQPDNMQAVTCCFAVDYLEGEDHTIERPEQYERWRDWVPELSPPWPGKMLDWTMANPVTLEPRPMAFVPGGNEWEGGKYNLWAYRRIADPSHFAPGTYPGEISTINWPQNDYIHGVFTGTDEELFARNLHDAKQLSLSLLYWMQTEAVSPGGMAGWKGLRLRRDAVGTEDGLAMYPYIREARRILAEFTVLEQHISTEARMDLTDQDRDTVLPEHFPDSVGIGAYRIDLHPSTGGDNYVDVSSLPFQIPMGALIPRRLENLLAASKNIGTTHITNGCYRVHPCEWNIGESAGALAVYALRQRESLRAVRATGRLLAEFQQELGRAGIPIEWPRVSPL